MKNQLMFQISEKILLSCNNRRLKAAFLFSGKWWNEGNRSPLKIENMDIQHFNTKPTKSQKKTKTAREVYISGMNQQYI